MPTATIRDVAAQAPGELEFADHLDAAALGFGEERGGRRPAGRGDDEGGVAGQFVDEARAGRDQCLGAGRARLVDQRDAGSPGDQCSRGCLAGEASAADDDGAGVRLTAAQFIIHLR